MKGERRMIQRVNVCIRGAGANSFVDILTLCPTFFCFPPTFK